jgi:cytochrome c-type biogenesis protein CcmH/NrfF
MLKEGKSEQQIVDAYVATYGGAQILSEPPNSGSGRIAWAMPVVVGVAGFLTVAYLALRWSRRPAMAGVPAGVEDPEMAARLDDELRELD